MGKKEVWRVRAFNCTGIGAGEATVDAGEAMVGGGGKLESNEEESLCARELRAVEERFPTGCA